MPKKKPKKKKPMFAVEIRYKGKWRLTDRTFKLKRDAKAQATKEQKETGYKTRVAKVIKHIEPISVVSRPFKITRISYEKVK